MSHSALSRFAVILVTAWGLTMVVPSFYRLIWPLGSLGLAVDNNGVVVDTAGPFENGLGRSPAATMGLAIGDRLDLRQMTCRKPRSPACAAVITILGGSGGLQDTFVGREVDLVLRPTAGKPGRIVHLRAKPAPLDLPGRLVLLADTVVGILTVLAAAWLVWVQPGWMTWGFFFYFSWFNPGQTYTYYAILQSLPLLLLVNQCLVALATGAAFAGLLIFAMRFPDSKPDPSWYRWERVTPWVGAFIGALTLLASANLFGVPTERIATAAYVCGFVIDAAVLAVLLIRRRTLHPRNEQRMRWVIAGCAIGLPSYIFAEIWEETGLLENAWGLAPSQTVLGLLYLIQGVLAYFVWMAVRRQRVISVAIPLRHGTVTAALALALAVPVMFLHERIAAAMHPTLHLPHWLWPLVLAPVTLLALQRVHEAAVELVDHAFNRAYHRSRHGLERAGRTVLETEGTTAIDRSLAEEPVHWLQLTSAAVFRYVDGALHRTEPTIGWAHATLQQLRPDLDGPVMECLTRRKPVRLLPQQWRGDFLPDEDQAPCLAVPIFGWAGQATAIALFGPHVSGSDITHDEYEMLQALAVHAGRGYDRAEMETLRRELRDLRTRLHDGLKVPPPLTER